MCVNLSDPTELSGVGGGYVDNKMVNFHIFKIDCTKEIYFVNFSLQFLSGLGN
jgi:hypothetical protein